MTQDELKIAMMYIKERLIALRPQLMAARDIGDGYLEYAYMQEIETLTRLGVEYGDRYRDLQSMAHEAPSAIEFVEHLLSIE